ncbi:GntR family transcriptional regulator [Carnobacterium gallinarum]|uniref:GntR family transcriptional regulator n=1 Tax=Carnobacterium gallinarum TaxID=2749 RepID=UPI0005566FBC|nr:GntR family transcriptional regulator [Carnobacterium gallinarum]
MSAVPKYRQIYIDIKEKINTGFYQLDEKIPDGDTLALDYDCSKLTVKKALDLLVKEGMMVRRRGSGTFIKGTSTNGGTIALGPTAGLVNTVGKQHISSKILQFSIEKPTDDVAKKLEIEDNGYIYKIVRLRSVNHKPYSIEHTYMPLSIIVGLEPKHLEDSIYNYIRDELGLKMQRAHVWIRGDHPSEEDNELLELPSSSFIMEIEKIAHLEDGRIFEYSFTRHRYEDFVFETVFVQN